MPKPNVPRPFSSVLASDATLGAWNERRRREDRVLRIVRRALPRPVAERVFVADAGGPVLLLSTAAGAIAAVARQRGPDIVGTLAREGFEFSGMRVRVQPRDELPLPSKRLPRQWDAACRRPVAALAATLPDSPLRAALARLLRRAG